MTDIPQDDSPATKEDVATLRREMHSRFEQTDRNVEGMRGQNSAEHGSLFSQNRYMTEIMVWLKSKWMSFSRNEPPKDKTWPGDKK